MRVARFAAVCLACWALTSCGSSPSATTAVVGPSSAALTAGAWTGMFNISSCTGDAAWCRGSSPLGPVAFSLRIDAGLHGVVELEPLYTTPIAVDVVGAGPAEGPWIFKGA